MTIWAEVIDELDHQIMEAERLSLAQAETVMALVRAGDGALEDRKRLSDQFDALEAMRRRRALLKRLLADVPNAFQEPPPDKRWH